MTIGRSLDHKIKKFTLFLLLTSSDASSSNSFKLITSPSSAAHNKAFKTKSSPFYKD